jgi:hypothetical protein
MTRRLLRDVCVLALSLGVGWGAQAQTVPDPGHQLEAPADVTLAVAPDALPEAITRQRQALAAQRTAIGQAEAAQQAACWQKFAVNACLSEARRARRQALEPLRQQELALNAQERLWRTEQRERRLQGKQTESRDTP